MVQRDDIVTVAARHRGGLGLPTVAEVTVSDGSTERVDVPVEGFGRSDEVTVTLGAAGRTVTRTRLDPDARLPDLDRANDTAMVSKSTPTGGLPVAETPPPDRRHCTR